MDGSLGMLSGTFAGRYRVERELGRGASATVYLARDSQRDRSVAIKVLRPELAATVGADRFLREIARNERLQHPYIVPVLDSGEHDGLLYFVLPHMEEGSLRQLMQREKQLPVESAVAIARAVAEALDYAHGQGLVHRDVKPENILFTSGKACLADFGIARAIERTIDESTTSTGLVRGTPAYMSPEQAGGGRDYDGRSDQFSLACVLYEMLAGMPAFMGPTPEAIIAQRFQHAPRKLNVYRPSVSPALESVIQRALSLTPADRFATLAAFSAALRDATRQSTVESKAPSGSTSAAALAHDGSGGTAGPSWAWRGIGIGALVLGAAVIAARDEIAPRFRSTPQVYTLDLPAPTGAQFTDDLRDVSAVSPDGKDIIIPGTDSSGVRNLWLQRLSDRVASRIPGTDWGAMAFWSPDGKTVGFFKRRALTVIDRTGRTGRTLATVTTNPRGGSWADDGTILYAPSSQSGIFATSLKDTTPRQLTTVSARRGEIGHMWPQALPGGHSFLYFVASDVDSVRGIYLASGDPPRSRRVVGSSASAVFSNGHLLFVSAGALVAQRLDVAAAALIGDRWRIADSVATSYEYSGVFSASQTNLLVYAGGRSRDISRLSWTDSTGSMLRFASAYGYLRNPDLSANGRYLAFETYRETDSDIQFLDLATGVSSVLADGGLQATDPVWSPDGSAIAFIAERPGVWNTYRKYVNRPDAPELLFSSPRYAVLTDWSADGFLILNEVNDAGDFDLVARPLTALGDPQVLASGPAHQVAGRVSSDGKFVVYVSLESGSPQVYAQRLPARGARCQVSANGGYQPVWGRTNGSVYFLSGSGTMMQATLDLSRSAPCPVAAPRALFQTNVRSPSRARSFFDVSMKDGLLLINAPPVENGAWLTVIVNWLAAGHLN